jgi:signal transduction histidine kinase
MTSPRVRRSKKASPVARVLVGFREASVRDQADTVGDRGSGGISAETHADVERLMDQMREANERLIVAAIHAQDQSDEAHAEALRAKTELDVLMSQLRDANERLAAGAAEAHAMAEEARLRQEEYRRLSIRLLTLQDEERRRLALDLHDSTAQSLAALTMNLAMIKVKKTALDARSHRALTQSRSLAKLCFGEVRTLAYLLHPPLLDEAGLLSAVRWFAEGFSQRSAIQVVLDLSEVGRLPGPIEVALFRIVQESLTNAHRHASTRTVSIRLTATAGAVALEIKDHGRGLRDQASRQQGQLGPGMLGVGIQGMRERISQLNGTFGVEFTDKGTTVQVGVPLNTADH